MFTICMSFLQSSVAKGESKSDKPKKYPHGADAAQHFSPLNTTIDVKHSISMQTDNEPELACGQITDPTS